MNDLKFAFRQLLKNPGFTIVAVLTLALCLGANLTIFAVIDSVLLRLLPFPESDQLVTMFNTYPKAGVERDGATLPNYYERRGNISAFSHISILRQGTAIVGDAGSTEQIDVTSVSPEFFTTLGVGPVIGNNRRIPCRVGDAGYPLRRASPAFGDPHCHRHGSECRDSSCMPFTNPPRQASRSRGST